MNTPICDFLKAYSKKHTLRLHMPGHKGSGFLGVEKFDITEIDGADQLYNGNGIIAQSQKNATKIFGTQKTLYSAEGSSLAVRAMVFLVSLFAKENGQKPLIFAFRNAHKSFMNAVAALNVDVEWIYPTGAQSILSCPVDAKQLEKYITGSQKHPTAVYLTSPNYLGEVADISALSKVCKKHNILLIVDNAHGAYLNFLKDNRHPISLGADMCCDSAHKTLPVITGGAYLHISKTAPEFLAQNAEIAMQFFASTSPSYLILASLDNFNKTYTSFEQKLNKFAPKIANLKAQLNNSGLKIVADEQLKITIMPKSYGYTGTELAKLLLQKNIVCEFYDQDHVVLMFSPLTKPRAINKLKKVLLRLKRRPEIKQAAPKMARPKQVLPITEAMLSPSENVPVENANGKIFASANISCPPAIPIVVAGEKIDQDCINTMKYYGIHFCHVVKPSNK